MQKQLLLHYQSDIYLLWTLNKQLWFRDNIFSRLLAHCYILLSEQDQILLARRGSYQRNPSNGAQYYHIKCYVVTDDGESFGLARTDLSIDEFPGAVKIQDMAVYPLCFHSNPQELCDRTIARGKVFASMTGYTYKEISGQAIRETESSSEKFYASSLFVVYLSRGTLTTHYLRQMGVSLLTLLHSGCFALTTA